MNATYKVIPNLIENLKTFEGNSCEAYYTPSGEYIIKSYATEILKVSEDKRTAIFNASGYSFTTSKLQNIIRRALANLDIEVKVVTGLYREAKL